jgi:uncharacterized membrane protein YhaH (DUF805 family)
MNFRKFFFSFAERITRLELLFAFSVLIIVQSFIANVGYYLTIEPVCTLLSLILALRIVPALLIKRIHDINWSGHWLWLLLLPFPVLLLVMLKLPVSYFEVFGIFATPARYAVEVLGFALFYPPLLIPFVLCFWKGTNGPNRFGEIPQPDGRLLKWTIAAGCAALLLVAVEYWTILRQLGVV